MFFFLKKGPNLCNVNFRGEKPLRVTKNAIRKFTSRAVLVGNDKPRYPTNTKSSTTIFSWILFWSASYCTSIWNTPASFGNSIERPNTSFRYNVTWFIFNRGFDYLTNVFIRNFKKQTNANFLGLFKHLKSGNLTCCLVFMSTFFSC